MISYLINPYVCKYIEIFIEQKTRVYSELRPGKVDSLDPTQTFGELFRSVQAGKYAVVKTLTAEALGTPEAPGDTRGTW